MSALAWFVVIAAAQTIWIGIVLQALWAWFMVPTFGWPHLNLPNSIGVGLVVSFLTHQYVPTDDTDLRKMIVDNFLFPLLALVLGFLVHLFV